MFENTRFIAAGLLCAGLLGACASTSSSTSPAASASASNLLTSITELRDATSFYNEIPADVAANATLRSNFAILAQRQPAALAAVKQKLARLKSLAAGVPTSGMPAGVNASSITSAIALYDQWVATQEKVVHVYETCNTLSGTAYNKCADSNLGILAEQNSATATLLNGLKALAQ